MKKISFKDYMESKRKLLEAIKDTPIATLKYSITKYCKMRVGETTDKRYEVACKPRQTILVEWKFDDIEQPEPVSVIFDDISPDEHEVYWTGSKLTEWLSKNAVEDISD